MFRTNFFLALALILVSCLPCAARQAPPPQASQTVPKNKVPVEEISKVETTVQSAQAPSTAKPRSVDFVKDIAGFRVAREQAKQSGTPTEEAEAALNEARTLELWSTVERDKVSHITDAAEAYRNALTVGTPSQRTLAANNLGVLLLRQRDPAKALEAFGQADLKAIDPATVYLYQYNYGRALELSGDKKAAYSRFSQAVTLRPDFSPAAEGASRVLWELKPAPVGEAAALSEALMRGGRADMARDLLKRALSGWSSEPNASQLLGELVRTYGVLGIEPIQFSREDWPLLQKLETSALGNGIRELQLAFSGGLPYSFDYSAASFPYWSRGTFREPFGELLKTIGDKYADQDSYPKALACYTNAWGVSHLPEAALYAATLLRDHRELDKDGRLLNRLIESLFLEKGGAYARQDWPNILRLHTVLGTIFESQSNWGSPGDPRSAIFQWQHALSAERQLRVKDAAVPPLPGLHLHLANCYLNVNRGAEARSEYLFAAEGFLQASDRGQAAAAVGKLHTVVATTEMPPDEQVRLRAVEAKLKG